MEQAPLFSKQFHKAWILYVMGFRELINKLVKNEEIWFQNIKIDNMYKFF